MRLVDLPPVGVGEIAEALFVPDGDHRMDARGMACGDVTGEASDGPEENRHRNQRWQVDRTNLKEHCPQVSRRACCCCKSHGDATERREEPPAESPVEGFDLAARQAPHGHELAGNERAIELARAPID